METLPILGRKFEDLLTLTPGVSIVQGPDGDEITFAGQRGIFNNISLDGGDYNNGFFGEQAGGQRAAIDITLDAVKEFQVIATGAPAEFGRTAGGVVNVITKSGTNAPHGTLFYFQRLEALTGELSDGIQPGWVPPRAVRRHVRRSDQDGQGVLLRSRSRGSPATSHGRTWAASSATPPARSPIPTVPQNEALINGQRRLPAHGAAGVLQYARSAWTKRLPIEHPVQTVAVLGKLDSTRRPSNNLSASWNFNHSRKENETFDVATYGTSANGIEGDPARINVGNLNWFTTLSDRVLNEAHFTYSRENRPRTAAASNLAADTGMGFAPTFRFGNPFFLQPAVDELIWRTQIKDNLSIVARRAHHQGRRRVDAHAERPGVPRLLHRPLHLRQRDRLPPLRVAGGPRRLRAADGRLPQRRLRHRARPLPERRHADRRSVAALPAGGGPDRTGHRRRPARRRSPTTNSSLFAAGPVAAAERPDRQLRPALGRAADARDDRSADDGVSARS